MMMMKAVLLLFACSLVAGQKLSDERVVFQVRGCAAPGGMDVPCSCYTPMHPPHIPLPTRP